jgi:hypothetical protein
MQRAQERALPAAALSNCIWSALVCARRVCKTHDPAWVCSSVQQRRGNECIEVCSSAVLMGV